MNMTVKVYEEGLPMREVAEGYKMAYHIEDKVSGVVDTAGNFKMTFPLNGHRARNLAEEIYRERTTAVWELGKAVIIPVRILNGLPGFDSRFYSAFEALIDLDIHVVTMTVVVHDESYGHHVILSVPSVHGGERTVDVL
jgi:hypothetical protein